MHLLDIIVEIDTQVEDGIELNTLCRHPRREDSVEVDTNVEDAIKFAEVKSTKYSSAHTFQSKE
jgi:hypothetical protein